MFRTHLPAYLVLPLAGAAPLLAQSPAQEAPAASQGASQQVPLQWGDFDGDGLVDALAVTPERRLQLMRNAGDGSFVDATAEARLGGVTAASFGLWQDYDQDGHLDLFVGTEAGPSALFRSVDGAFVNVTDQVGIDSVGADRSARWVDYDQDGRMDLQLAYDGFNVFFHALPTGGFERVELPATLVDTGLVAPVIVAQVVKPAEGPAAQGAAASGSDTSSSLLGLGHDFSNGQRRSLSGDGAFPGAGASGSGGQVDSNLGISGLSGICTGSILDQSGAGCIEASSVPGLGMLYPLTENLFVQDFSGNVGVGTTAPERDLHVVSDSFWPVLIESVVSAGLQLNSVGQDSSWAIYHDVDDSLTILDSEASVVRMKIRGDDGAVEVPTSLVVDTISPNLGLRVEGMVRSGSETGTDQPPTTAYPYTGMVNRRIASTTTATGSVVARSQFMRLVRDGSFGQFTMEWDALSLNDQVVYGTGIKADGTTISIVFNFGGPVDAGSQVLFTDTDVVRLDLAFGTTFNIREMTEVTMMRSLGDFWWTGSLTSNWDQ